MNIKDVFIFFLFIPIHLVVHFEQTPINHTNNVDWVRKSQAKFFYPRSIHTYWTSEEWHIRYHILDVVAACIFYRFDLIVFIFWNMNGIWEIFDRKILIYFVVVVVVGVAVDYSLQNPSGTSLFIEPLLIMWLVCL